MQPYLVRYTAEFMDDLIRSYEWGVEMWGIELANQWYNELNDSLETRLSSMPRSCPPAPESREVKNVRQLLLGRYRVLFTISGNYVRVLHLRGLYSGPG